MLWIQIIALVLLAVPSVLLIHYIMVADRFDLNRQTAKTTEVTHENPTSMKRAA